MKKTERIEHAPRIQLVFEGFYPEMKFLNCFDGLDSLFPLINFQKLENNGNFNLQ